MKTHVVESQSPLPHLFPEDIAELHCKVSTVMLVPVAMIMNENALDSSSIICYAVSLGSEVHDIAKDLVGRRI